jgi:regulator of protease activity HflC (stomatin/prohibitin superfamily)
MMDLVTARDKLASTIRDILDVATDPWGVSVERVEM